MATSTYTGNLYRGSTSSTAKFEANVALFFRSQPREDEALFGAYGVAQNEKTIYRYNADTLTLLNADRKQEIKFEGKTWSTPDIDQPNKDVFLIHANKCESNIDGFMLPTEVVVLARSKAKLKHTGTIVLNNTKTVSGFLSDV